MTCKHESIKPNEDELIWYVLNEETGGEYWSETDIAYIKLQRIKRKFICLGCGETRSIRSSEEVGGTGGIRIKEDMSQDELKQFQQEVHSGAFFN